MMRCGFYPPPALAAGRSANALERGRRGGGYGVASQKEPPTPPRHARRARGGGGEKQLRILGQGSGKREGRHCPIGESRPCFSGVEASDTRWSSGPPRCLGPTETTCC